MADTTALKNRIRSAIKANDNQEITGPVLQAELIDIVNELNQGTENETSRAQNAEANLGQRIGEEASRAQNAEVSLNQAINQLIAALDTMTFSYNTPAAQQATRAMLDVIITVAGNPHTLSTLTLGSATTLAAGLMSAVDKQKLDAILTNLRSLRVEDITSDVDLGNKIVESLKITIEDVEETISTFQLLAATASKAGLLSAADKAKLDALWSSGYQFAGIATPSTTPISTTSKIFYIATEAGTYFNAVTVTQGINIIYKSGDAWSVAQVVGIDNEPTAGSDRLVKSGGVFGELALGAVYDVSAKNPTAGPNSDGKWESLSALLSDANLNTLIPTSVRKGGMSIKYVQSSDNKYVQALCMNQNFTTDVTQWQGVDDEPTAGSKNLVKSGGVVESTILNCGTFNFKKHLIPSSTVQYIASNIKANNGFIEIIINTYNAVFTSNDYKDILVLVINNKFYIFSDFIISENKITVYGNIDNYEELAIGVRSNVVVSEGDIDITIKVNDAFKNEQSQNSQKLYSISSDKLKQVEDTLYSRLENGTDNIFNKRDIVFNELYIRSGTAHINTNAKRGFLIKLTNTKDISKRYVWNRFDDISLDDLYISTIGLVSCAVEIEDGVAVTISSQNPSTIRGFLTPNNDSYLYLYVEFKAFNHLIYLSDIEILNTLYLIVDKICVGCRTTYFTEYIDYYKPIPNPTLNDLGGLPKNQGSENSGKYMSVNSDGNIIPVDIPGITPSSDEGLVKKIGDKTLYLTDNLLVNPSVTSGNGWTGDFINGFTHTSGNTEALEINYNTVSGKKYVIGFTLGSTSENSVYVSIGDYPLVDVYNGRTDIKIGIISEGGTIKITPSSQYNSTVSNITLKEVVSEEDSVSQEQINIQNVNHGSTVNNITGFWNIAIGADNTLRKNENGSRNIALGKSSLSELKTGTRNIAIGTFSAPFLVSGERNIAIGADSLYSVDKGDDNVAIGKAAIGCLVPQREKCNASIGIGTNSLYFTGKSNHNVAIGYFALGGKVDSPSQNVCIGAYAGNYSNMRNTYIGYRAGYYFRGDDNTTIGHNTFTLYVTGSRNTLLGSQARTYNTTASPDNIVTINNAIAIGYDAKVTKSNQVVIGNINNDEFVFGSKKLIFNQDGTISWETIS